MVVVVATKGNNKTDKKICQIFRELKRRFLTDCVVQEGNYEDCQDCQYRNVMSDEVTWKMVKILIQST